MKTYINRLLLFSVCLTTGLVAQAQETDTLKSDTPAPSSLATPPATEEVRSDYRRSYFDRSDSPWFRSGAFLVGVSLGFATGKGQGLYTVFNPRVGYFIKRGLALGIRGAFESRASTSYRANSGGAFVRYYPIRNTFYLFGEGGLNIGKFRSSDVGPNDRRGFSSLNIGLGVGLKAMEKLSFELMIENNYYDKAPVFAGNNRGPQVKLGANLHIGGRRRY
ncbi:hypothetical protein GCM10028803_40780 [Larkinella knui]|uniref:Outer membrane protein beta-barrel domain-containing protein n=1 Tax=Larkinella knui TaxID=2025310 RepID=A0A3P1CN25_9BACT|nr:hypothetical protein [Larkinella knui]RRB14712.1 hypothetical protein EHT87_09070 [Larkinella knui]